ncbi:unnamed protein product [Closterium sp. Naga37s-1]|nr:unnamed protein product [Closterium sp. Naga37s-1]
MSPLRPNPCSRSPRWIRSPHTKPSYSAYSCKTIRSQANCYKNGRRDYNYLNWRWQPDECTLQRFDSGKFLSKYRNKVIGIAGDSFSANFEDSLQCILSSNSSTSRMTSSLDTEDVSGFIIDAYNVTVLHIAAAFLVDASPVGKASSSGVWNINLDKPHSSWAKLLDDIDVFIFNAGHWFVNAPDSLRQYYIGGVKQSGLTGFAAMKIALTTVRNTIVKSNFRGTPVLLTFSPFHYSDSFDTGKDCAGWWRPMTQEEFQVALEKSEAAEAVKEQLAVFTNSGGSGVTAQGFLLLEFFQGQKDFLVLQERFLLKFFFQELVFLVL